MRILGVIAIALAAAFAWPVAGQVNDQAGGGLRLNDARHNFGMEWRPRPGADLDLKLPPEILNAVDAWRHLPERLEAAASLATFSTGAAAATIVLLVVALAVVGARSR